jgi:ZIP family zinc transporter
MTEKLKSAGRILAANRPDARADCSAQDFSASQRRMLVVVSHEIIPESHRNGHETRATIGVMIGFVAMMLLDTMLA